MNRKISVSMRRIGASLCLLAVPTYGFYSYFYSSNPASPRQSSSAASGHPVTNQDRIIPPNKIVLMSYNVENLFDNKHDDDKDDWAFLPNAYPGKRAACAKIKQYIYRRECLETDWTDEAITLKLSQLKKMITDDGRRPIPDMLAAIEVKNSNIVQALSNELGYRHFVITQSLDKRSVNIALLFNDKPAMIYQRWQEHIVSDDYLTENPTRNILEVQFTVGRGQPFYIFVNHWPSQQHPTTTRMSAAKVLKQRIDTILRDNANAAIAAVGDFNTLTQDSPNPFNAIILQDGVLVDAYDEFMRSTAITKSQKEALPPGTFFYPSDNTWSRLDRMFFSRNLIQDATAAGLTIDLASFAIYAPSFARTDYVYSLQSKYKGELVKGIPIKYNVKARNGADAGFSDHFPEVITFKVGTK